MTSHFSPKTNGAKTTPTSPKVPQFMWTSVETLLPKITSPFMGGNLGEVLGTFGESGLGKISDSVPVVDNRKVVQQIFRPMGENHLRDQRGHAASPAGCHSTKFKIDFTHMTKIDLTRIEDHQRTIHARLLNWASWSYERPCSIVQPMFAQYRSNARQWHAPEFRETCNIFDAQFIEKAVCKLPEKNRLAIKWFYIERTHPGKRTRHIAANDAGLYQLVRDGRQMLINAVGNTEVSQRAYAPLPERVPAPAGV